MAAARRNNSTQAEIQPEDLNNPFAEGALRLVAKEKYVMGERKGQACVAKWFKSGTVYEVVYFKDDIKAAEKALEILEKWNASGFINRHAYLNMPEVWIGVSGQIEGHMLLIEPFIENWVKFNSNTGWADTDTPWPRVMQALSHFSYHTTGGNMDLCDLQGGYYRDGVILSDPVILSRTKSFGVTDLGPAGISSFFSHHVCNEYCRSSWQTPRDRAMHYTPIKSTTMEYVPTHHSRAPLTRSG